MSENNEVEFKLIMHSGNAKSYAMEAIREADKGNFEKANELLKEADKELLNAQKSHSGVVQSEAAGERVEVSLLLVHAEDHLASSTVLVSLAKEMVKMHHKLNKENN